MPIKLCYLLAQNSVPFGASPDCTVSRALQRTVAKTGQKQPKIAVFRGDNPLRIAYLTANLTVSPNLRNMARIFGGIGKNEYLCTSSAVSSDCDLANKGAAIRDGLQPL